jgi:hypothetical protein
MRISSCIGVDATRPFGEPFYDVADVPGWQDFAMPELDWGRGIAGASDGAVSASRTHTPWTPGQQALKRCLAET